MTRPDPVLARLAELPVAGPEADLSTRLRAAAHARLSPRPVGRLWPAFVAAVAIGYLGWAVHFVASL